MPPSVTDYSPLETLRLVELIPKHGIEPTSFVNISNDITNDARVRAEESFDEQRLTPEALQGHLLQILREEHDPNESKGNGDKAAGSVSPDSKKRKLSSPPVPILTEIRGHIHKLVALDERVYERYIQWRVTALKEDEQRFFQLQKEIAELEIAEEAEKAQKAAAAAAAAAAAVATAAATATAGSTAKPSEPKTSPVEEQRTTVANGNQSVPLSINGGGQGINGTVPSPASVPAQSSQPLPPPARISPLLPRQAPPVSSTGTSPTPPAFARPNVPPQGSGVHPGLPATSPDAPKPAATTGPILQAPQGAVGFSPLPASSTARPELETPRAESVVRPKSILHPNASSPATGNLKWEPPYIPHLSQKAGPVPAPPSSQSPIVVHATPGAPQYQHGTQPMQSPFVAPTVPAQQQQQLRQPHQPVLAAPQLPSNLAAPNLAGIPPSQPPLSTNLQQQALHPAQSHPTPGQMMHNQAQVLPSLPPRTSQVASASPAIGAGPSAAFQPPLRQQPSSQGQQVASSASFAGPSAPPAATFGTPIPAGASHRPINTPHSRFSQQSVADTLAQRVAAPSVVFLQQQQTPFPPSTPIGSRTTPLLIPRGSGTKWKAGMSTPSTPRLGIGEVQSPAFEPLSPPPVAAKLPAQTSHTPGQKVPLKVAPTPDPTVSRRRGKTATATQKGSQDNDVQTAQSPRIKNEDDSGLKPPEETGDTTAEESGLSQHQTTTPSGASSRPIKRKRADSATNESQTPVPVKTPATHVLWTRGFPKISASVLDQISSHKNANMFAHKIRDRDAPGYSNIVLQPIDLKSIRAAIQQGNRSAIAAATALPNGDPGTSSVWLPINEELIPPKAIINGSQLECELVHMFANAIMYNPDPYRGFGPAFMIEAMQDGDEDDEDANVLGYAVDQDAVVNQTRTMYCRVQELLTNIRDTPAEKHPPPLPAGATGTGASSQLQTSSVGLGANIDPATTEDDGEQAATTEVEAEGSGTIKRRRTARA